MTTQVLSHNLDDHVASSATRTNGNSLVFSSNSSNETLQSYVGFGGGLLFSIGYSEVQVTD